MTIKLGTYLYAGINLSLLQQELNYAIPQEIPTPEGIPNFSRANSVDRDSQASSVNTTQQLMQLMINMQSQIDSLKSKWPELDLTFNFQPTWA